ncbi:MAG TPA: hypothetical protein VJH20_00640 [Candidatus Nanoarchaeia archaeon]|nr:hypothetical protein [Candidatus Nanoarchaeia archaeon]
MVKVTIIAERPLGYPDADLSIDIPDSGVLPKEIDKVPSVVPELATFMESYGIHSPPINARSFTAVKAGNLYMLWIEERQEWVGIKYELKDSHYEQNVWGGGIEKRI